MQYIQTSTSFFKNSNINWREITHVIYKEIMQKVNACLKTVILIGEIRHAKGVTHCKKMRRNQINKIHTNTLQGCADCLCSFNFVYFYMAPVSPGLVCASAFVDGILCDVEIA